MTGQSSPKDISPRLQRIAKVSRERPQMVWTTLAHHIDVDLLKAAYRRVRKDGAPGVDGQTAQEYGDNLEANLASLLHRFKTGTYRAPPVRRAYIPKGRGKTRPIGIPTVEDRVLQRAVAMVMSAVYEQDFVDCSYGFRPGRGAHDALDALSSGLVRMAGGVVLDVDIEGFFDALDHNHLRSFLDQRMRDGVLRRVIGKWLKAGVHEDGAVKRTEEGTPQGGVISSLLANIYLHEVIDIWFDETVKPRLRASAFMVRYADDIVMVFASEQDARRVMDVLPKRLGKYGLTLNPDKTRMISYRRPPRAATGKGRDDDGNPGTFTFLGFTHYWGRSRKGNWVVKRRTARRHFTAALQRVTEWMRHHRHQSVVDQHTQLVLKLRGHYAYYGIIGNIDALARFRVAVMLQWFKWLRRRNARGRMRWERFRNLLLHFQLPYPRIYARSKPMV